jgi:hypothetical protein
MSRQFWVISQDGQSYGPADEPTLSQWAREGRLTSLSTLQDAATNQRVQASQVPSLAAVFGPQQQAGYQQPQAYQQPSGYQQQQTAIPMAAGYGMPQAGYQQPVQPVGYANPYAQAGAVDHQLSSFSGAALVLLHFVTLGIFSWIHFNLMHGKMPPRRPDDPSAGKAVGFMFIPIFSIYWWFFSNLRLMDRINEQRVAAGLPPSAPKGFFIACSVLLIIPLVNYISILILFPIMWGTMQGCVNELVRTTRGPNA